MSRCKTCGREFPNHLIAAGMFNGTEITQCPICALKLRNKIHGLPKDEKFHGPIARAMYKEAVRHIGKKAKKEAKP